MVDVFPERCSGGVEITKYCEICEAAFHGDSLEHIEKEHPEIMGKDAMLNFEAWHIEDVYP